MQLGHFEDTTSESLPSHTVAALIRPTSLILSTLKITTWLCGYSFWFRLLALTVQTVSHVQELPYMFQFSHATFVRDSTPAHTQPGVRQYVSKILCPTVLARICGVPCDVLRVFGSSVAPLGFHGSPTHSLRVIFPTLLLVPISGVNNANSSVLWSFYNEDTHQSQVQIVSVLRISQREDFAEWWNITCASLPPHAPVWSLSWYFHYIGLSSCVWPSRSGKKIRPNLWLPWLRLSSRGLLTDLFKSVVDCDSWTFSHSQRFVVRDVRLELSHPHRSRTMIGMGSVSTHVFVGDVLEQICQIGDCFLRIHLDSTCAFFHQPLPPDPRLTPISHSWWQEKQTLTGHSHHRFFWHPRHWHRCRWQCQNPWFRRELSSCFGSHKHPWWSFLRHKAWRLWSLHCQYNFSRTTSNPLRAWPQNSHSSSFTHLDCICKLSWTGRNNWARIYNRTFIVRKCWHDECRFGFGVCHGKDVRVSLVFVDHVVADALNSLTFEASIILVTLTSVVLFTGNFCTCSVRFTLSFSLILCLLSLRCFSFCFFLFCSSWDGFPSPCHALMSRWYGSLSVITCVRMYHFWNWYCASSLPIFQHQLQQGPERFWAPRRGL